MRQIEKDKVVWIRKGASVLRGEAPAEGEDTRVPEKLEAPFLGKVATPPLTRNHGTVEIPLTGGKKAVVSVRRVIRPGDIIGQSQTVTVLPSSEILTSP